MLVRSGVLIAYSDKRQILGGGVTPQKGIISGTDTLTVPMCTHFKRTYTNRQRIPF